MFTFGRKDSTVVFATPENAGAPAKKKAFCPATESWNTEVADRFSPPPSAILQLSDKIPKGPPWCKTEGNHNDWK